MYLCQSLTHSQSYTLFIINTNSRCLVFFKRNSIRVERASTEEKVNCLCKLLASKRDSGEKTTLSDKIKTNAGSKLTDLVVDF